MKMPAVICTFSCFQREQNAKEGLKYKAKKVKRCIWTTSYFFSEDIKIEKCEQCRRRKKLNLDGSSA